MPMRAWLRAAATGRRRRPWPPCSRGLGIALKIADGSRSALRVAVAAAIEQLDLLPLRRHPDLARWRDSELCNHAGSRIGRLMPVFELG